MKCTLDQLMLIDAYVHPQLPEPPADFTRLLPRYLTLKIFTFLDPRSLCRATQVSPTLHNTHNILMDYHYIGMLVLALSD